MVLQRCVSFSSIVFLFATIGQFAGALRASRIHVEGGNASAAVRVNKSAVSMAAPAFPRALPLLNKTHSDGSVPGFDPGFTQAPGRAMRIYFLFLAVDKISNLGVWEAFFAQASPEQYRAFVHCKETSCVAQVAKTQIKSVQSVPSYYCTDLVSPMNQLLSQALWLDSGPTNPADKFAFVSDSTLPAKPFSWLYATYASRQGSDFCLFPSGEWADIFNGHTMEVVPKHHQWVTLERPHAVKAMELWGQGHWHHFMSHFGLNHHAATASNNSFADSRNFGCLDEFWYMVALFGSITNVDPVGERLIDLYHFSGSPLHVVAGAGWQGSCDTFVVWSKYLHAKGNNPFEKMHWALDAQSIPHSGNSARPGWWDTISSTGIHAIRNSEFLFVRKFVDNPHLVDAADFQTTYAQIVLG